MLYTGRSQKPCSMFPAKVSTASNESLSAIAILAAQTASVRDALLCRNALAVCKAEEECAWRKAILSPRAVTQAARLNSWIRLRSWCRRLRASMTGSGASSAPVIQSLSCLA